MRVTDNGEVFCRPHFLEHSAEVGNLSVCLRCLGPIDPYEGYVTMQGDAGGAAKVGGRTKSEAQQHRWHSACFTCADCGSVDNPKTTLSSAGARIAARSNATKQGLLLGKGKAWGAFGRLTKAVLARCCWICVAVCCQESAVETRGRGRGKIRLS